MAAFLLVRLQRGLSNNTETREHCFFSCAFDHNVFATRQPCLLFPMARRLRILACAALLSTLFLTFRLLRDATTSFDQSHHPYDFGTSPTHQAPLPVPAPSPKSEWCQYNDCLKGKWVPRNPSFKNLAEFQQAYKNNQEPIWSRAPIPSPSISGLEFTDEEKAVLETQRFIDLMNYVWEPTEGLGKMKKFDPEEFVVQMLRTPGGLIMIGGQFVFFVFFSDESVDKGG